MKHNDDKKKILQYIFIIMSIRIEKIVSIGKSKLIVFYHVKALSHENVGSSFTLKVSTCGEAQKP